MTSTSPPDDPQGGSRSFFRELRRRHVVRSALAYAAVVFVLLQLAEIILPAFRTGMQAEALIRLLVVGAVLLLPVVLAAAWVWEITPRGIRSMRDIDAEAGIDSGGSLAHRAAFLGVTLAAVAAAGVWWWQTEEGLPVSGAGLPASNSPFVAASADAGDEDGPIGSLAVLPLEDLSGDEEDFFAQGMHEAILSEVSRISALRVISRTSVVQYSQEGKSLPQIGAELGVDAIVEGSVLRSGDRVRITVQLIHAATDAHIWAESYERDLDDVITLQREVAEAITAEIRAQVEARLDQVDATGVDLAEALPDLGTSTDGSAPTAPAAAQEAVMRGRVSLFDEAEVASTPDVPGVENVPSAWEAESFFREALAMDSAFVPALSGLAGTLVIRGVESGEAGRAQVEAAREMAVRALEIDPGNPEAAEILEGTRAALAALRADLGDSVQIMVAPNTPLGMTIHRYIAEAEMREGSDDPRAAVRSFLRLLGVGRIHEALELGDDLMDQGVEEPLLFEGMEQGWRLVGDLGEVVDLVEERDGDEGASALDDAVDRDGVAGYWGWKRAWIADRDAAGLPVSPTVRATALLAGGDARGGLEWLHRAAGEHDPLLGLTRHDRTWDRVRATRGFAEAIAEARRPRPPGRD